MQKLKIIFGLTSLCVAFAQTGLTADLLISRYNLARTSVTTDEIALNVSNVNVSGFGKIRTLAADAQVYAQPLYISSVPIYNSSNQFQGRHNVVLVCTEHDTVYAYDADTGATLWKRTVIPTGQSYSDSVNCTDLTPSFGITSTPAVDLNAGPHGRIFLASYSRDTAGNYHQWINALDLSTGQDAIPAVELAATYPGTGPESSNGVITFHPFMSWVRAGVVLWNNTIYLTFASHCDNETFTNNVNGSKYVGGYSGFIMAYDEATLKQVAVGNLVPNGGPPDGDLQYGSGGTIWNAGCAAAVDSNGYMYGSDGNGAFNPAAGSYSDSLVKLSTNLSTGRVSVVDYFTPYNQAALAAKDQDYGSGSSLVIPDQKDASGKVWHLVTANGKDGNIYIANRDNLGKYNAGGSDNHNIYQEIVQGAAGGVFSSPAYFNGALYFGPASHQIRRFSFTNAKLNTVPDNMSPNTFAWPGTSPTISAFGTANGILWAHERTKTNAILHAYDANDLDDELWNSSQNSSRDGLDTPVKFVLPTVANGRVFIGTVTAVTEYGLLSPTLATNVSSSVRVSRAGVTKLSNGHYQQFVTVTNNSPSTLTGPLSLVVDNLSASAYLYNRSGATTVVTPAASAYQNGLLTGSIAPGQGVTYRLEFVNPSGATVSYTTRVLAGSGSR